MATDISNLGNKVANDGATPQGILTYTDWNTLVKAVQEQQTASSEETQARQNADSTLQQAINNETAARKSADTDLAGNIENEANSRAAGDVALQKNIDAEAETRQNADETLQGNIDKEATTRQTADTTILGVANNALKGATARFSRIVETGTVSLVSVPDVTEVVYVRSERKFAGVWSGGYCNNWNTADQYLNDNRSAILKDKVYVCEDTLYVWSDEDGDLVKASGGGSGSGFYNVTLMHPLGSGYYTKETAVAALADADIDDADKPGTIITFEVSAGKWEDYRFCGTDVETFLEAAAWERYGGADAIKKIKVTRGTATEEKLPNEQGEVTIDIPQVEVDQSVNENSTNPVSGKAVSAAINEKASTYGTALQLNEIGDGDDKAYSLSLLNESGEVISTSDMFTGGGGGTVATTKVQLTRITPNKTVKVSDEVKLTYKYDQTDTTTGESTGNPGRVTVTITQGANTNTLTQNVAAGSTNTVDVSQYMGVGTNTVRVRVEVGEGAEMQVSQVTWSINVVQLTLSSSFNIATAITKGQSVSIPYALSGAGTKTLRCYVDGTDTEDRSITSSTANGSFSISTSNMAHGTHSVQMVVELELGDGSTIKSNSIYFAIGVRETGNNAPVVSARFDYTDGAIIETGTTPYVQTKQYDNYTLQYAAYNPRETPTQADVYVGQTLASSASVSFSAQNLTLRATNYGEEQCRIVVGATTFAFRLIAEKSDLDISEPTDGLTLKLTAQGRSNSDVNREDWSYNGIKTVFDGFKWGGDGWIGNALRLTDTARATVQHRPLEQPEQNVTNAMAFVVKFKVSEVVDEDAEVIRCMDAAGTGFVITAQEARMVTRGKSELSMKMASGEVYEVAFVSFPKSVDGSSDYEKLNTEMVYLYINGIMSGSVQRATSDSVYQATPAYIELGADGATTDVYLMRAYDTYLSDSQVLETYMVDQDSSEDMMALYESNDVMDENGNVTVDSVPDGMRYIIITGRQDNGVATVLQAAVNNDKDPKYDVDEMLCVVKGNQGLNFKCVGGCIRLQGTSSLAYPIKNYRIYFKNSSKVAGQLYLGCDEQGVGGELQEKTEYSFRPASSAQKQAAPVDCFCLKADYAESSSSHNTGMAKLVQNVLTAAGELTPAQKHCDGSYQYDVRTTIDGEPCYLFYRGSVDETPQFLGKFNFNNDKSTEAVFGFLDIPGYHDQAWVTEKFGGQNPTECWEFLNNDYPMGMFLDDDFDTKGEDGTPNWLKVFEARFPDDDDINAEYEAGTRKPKYLEPLVKWVKSTQNDGAKFKAELADWFDVDYLCDYYMFTDIMGCVDQRVKNMMMAFWYDPDKDKTLAYMIFYDCDTILGVRNDGRLKYNWDVNEDTTDPELSTPEKTVYAYAGHDSILWKNLREQFPDELAAAYKRIRERMSNSTIFNMFDTEQSAKFCERIYNIDAQNKYVEPKTQGVEVNNDGSVTNVKYSYLEAMQGSRKSHRHWWVTNRMGLFDARYSAGQYTATDISFKGNSAAGATVRATPARDFYFEFRRESTVMTHDAVAKDSEWSYTYDQTANIGTIFHIYGGEWMKKLDVGDWGGFTDMSLPNLPVLEELILGNSTKTYALTELVLGTKLPMLRKLAVVNYTNLPSLDLSGCNRLEEVDAAGCTALSTINFAEGAAVNKLHLPANFQTLTLRSMQYLMWSAITFDNKSNLTGVWIENCAQIDGLAVFKELFALKGQLKYVRITGLELEGDGSDLKQWYEAGLGGIDASGNPTNTKCKLVGTYRLTSYLDDDVYAQYTERFDELNIKQPEYTLIMFDDRVSDSANISNLDNSTGYEFSNKYVPSAHINKILAKRHRVLGKKTAEGEVTVCQLDDTNSNKYYDGTASVLTGAEGNVFMFEPHYWYKGINDLLNRKKYAGYSSNDECPSSNAEFVKVEFPQLTVRQGYAINANGSEATLEEVITAFANDSYCTVDVKGYKQVRWPSLASALYGAVLVDDDGNILKRMRVGSDAGCVDGMYLFTDIPDGAASLVFTIVNSAPFDYVLLTKSEKVEDIEPDWVEHTECLVGVYEAQMKDDLLFSISGVQSTANITKGDFAVYASNRGKGFQIIDYEMHKDVGNLFFAKYGERDSQGTCGPGTHTNSRATGTSDATGMQDTKPTAKDGDPLPTVSDNYYPNANAYVLKNPDDEQRTAIGSPVVMSYENWNGNKAEWMLVDYNRSAVDYIWRSPMPDGTEREIQGPKSTGDLYPKCVIHGRFMDTIVAVSGGSQTTYYYDNCHQSGSTSRVVCRSYSNANAGGGVSSASSGYDSGYVYAGIGSRLAFRGIIKWAASVQAFKAISEAA